MTTATVSTLDAIVGGTHDDHLDAIVDAVKTRRAVLARRVLSTINVGDTVAVNDKVRPKYLAGIRLVVTKVNGESVSGTVHDDDKARAGRYSNGPVRLPKDLIDAAR